jgi:pyridoxine 5'-phosphate synthase PdxJ
MKIKELVHALQQHDAEAPVFVNGYEDGVNDACSVSVVNVALDTGEQWYNGKHSVLTDLFDSEYKHHAKVQGVHIH